MDHHVISINTRPVTKRSTNSGATRWPRTMRVAHTAEVNSFRSIASR